MRTVFGLVVLDSGAVRWRGAPIGPEQRARFGYMPEERGLYPRMRVRDQLVYLGRLCGRTSSAGNRTVDTWLERLGLSTRAGDRLDALSHGNQQRVQLIAGRRPAADLVRRLVGFDRGRPPASTRAVSPPMTSTRSAAALGYELIDLYGPSYGATLAQNYIRQHPDHVRVAIMDGGTPLDVPVFEPMADNSQAALELLFDRCAADVACDAALPDLSTEWSELAARWPQESTPASRILTPASRWWRRSTKSPRTSTRRC